MVATPVYVGTAGVYPRAAQRATVARPTFLLSPEKSTHSATGAILQNGTRTARFRRSLSDLEACVVCLVSSHRSSRNSASCLTEAPRCLATLSREHRDGWGIAIHRAGDGDGDAAPSAGISTRERRRPSTTSASTSSPTRSRGHLLVAHVRQKTVGPTRLENTHPFVRDGWVFAHNGTIQHQDALRARLLRATSSRDQRATPTASCSSRTCSRGSTSAGSCVSTTRRARELADDADPRAHRGAPRAARIGAFNFLLSDGQTTFAHRFGRSLFVLERAPARSGARGAFASTPAATITTKWTPRRQAILIASERITDEPWREVDDGTLLRIERTPAHAQSVMTRVSDGQRVAS